MALGFRVYEQSAYGQAFSGLGEPPITPYPWQFDQPQPWTWSRAAPVIGVIAGTLGIAVAVRALMARRKRRSSR